MSHLSVTTADILLLFQIDNYNVKYKFKIYIFNIPLQLL
jgi:hypothetical protein